MKKYVYILFSIGLMHLLPLVGQWEYLFATPMLIVLVSACIILSSQPNFSVEEANNWKKEDRFSIYKIKAAAFLGQMAAVLEWRFFHMPDAATNSSPSFYLGLCLLITGLGIRLWAIKVLGDFFTSTVQIQHNHQLIQQGPYKLLRHPSYTGAYLAILGSILILDALISLIFTSIAMLWAYNERIKAEECALESALGAAYRSYKKSSYRLFPFIW